MNNNNRKGFFTSSQMSRLINFDTRKMTKDEIAALKKENPKSRKTTTQGDGFGAPGLTYIEEVWLEREIGRVLDTEVKTQPIKWGSLMEVVLFDLLGLGYKMTHKQTLVHPKHSLFWSGTPDLIAEKKKIGEIKCYQPKKFAQLSKCLLKKSIPLFKEQFKEEYWQCVSNAILCGVTRAEIIAYMPYKKELEEIIEKIEDTNFLERNGLDPADYYFMTRNDIESLAYLPDDSKMSNINSFEFEIPEEDIKLLTERILSAEEKVQELSKAA